MSRAVRLAPTANIRRSVQLSRPGRSTWSGRQRRRVEQRRRRVPRRRRVGSVSVTTPSCTSRRTPAGAASDGGASDGAASDESSRIATSSTSAPPLSCWARSHEALGQPVQVGVAFCGQHVDQPFGPEQFVGSGAAALDQAVGVHAAAPSRVEDDLGDVPGRGRGDAQRQAARRGATVAGRGPSTSGGGCPASRTRASTRPAPSTVVERAQGDGRGGGEQRPVVALAHQHLLQLGQQLRLVDAGQHQRAPRHPQQRAERGLVGPVPADVADDRVHRPGRAEHGVEEVAADHRAGAAGAVEGAGADRAAGQERRRQQPALQAHRLRGGQLLLAQSQQAAPRRGGARPRSGWPGRAPRRPPCP